MLIFSIIILAFVFLSGCQTSDYDENEPKEHENASAIVTDSGDGRLNVTLTGIGDNYGSGYKDFDILIEGENVLNLPTRFILGESFLIGKHNLDYYVNAGRLPVDNYSVLIIVRDTIIYNGDVMIS